MRVEGLSNSTIYTTYRWLVFFPIHPSSSQPCRLMVARVGRCWKFLFGCRIYRACGSKERSVTAVSLAYCRQYTATACSETGPAEMDSIFVSGEAGSAAPFFHAWRQALLPVQATNHRFLACGEPGWSWCNKPNMPRERDLSSCANITWVQNMRLARIPCDFVLLCQPMIYCSQNMQIY
jgi:hypothetical protein